MSLENYRLYKFEFKKAMDDPNRIGFFLGNVYVPIKGQIGSFQIEKYLKFNFFVTNKAAPQYEGNLENITIASFLELERYISGSRFHERDAPIFFEEINPLPEVIIEKIKSLLTHSRVDTRDFARKVLKIYGV